MNDLVSELTIGSLALQVLNSMLQQEFLARPWKQSKYLSWFLVWADDALYSWIAVAKLMSNLFRVKSMDFVCVQDVNTLMWQQNLKLLLLHVFFSQRPLRFLNSLTLTATYTADNLFFGINNANLQKIILDGHIILPDHWWRHFDSLASVRIKHLLAHCK